MSAGGAKGVGPPPLIKTSCEIFVALLGYKAVIRLQLKHTQSTFSLLDQKQRLQLPIRMSNEDAFSFIFFLHKIIKNRQSLAQ